MSLPSSNLYNVQIIPGAGRGVIASEPIAQGTLLLQTRRPAAHVLFRQYRKEVCASCFHYNLGRTLPIRHALADKVFCSPDCRDAWLAETGEPGVSAWEKVYAFVTARSNAITNAHSLPALCAKPTAEEIAASWSKATALSDEVRRLQLSPSRKKKQKHQNLVPNEVVDPDILSFFLSGILSHHRNPSKWEQDLQCLAMDPQPYRSSSDLEAHCNSFIQLSSLFTPQEEALNPNLTAPICQLLIGAASHNAFGIHSGSDEGEEYLGYAVVPEASYFNHSCSPNISKKRVGAAWEFVAGRDIKQGEECCITYLGGDERDLSVVARRARLRTHWGFECGCLRCLEEGREEEG